MISKARAIIGGFLHRAGARQALQEVLRSTADASSLANWSRSLQDPTGFYLDCVRVFHSRQFPQELKAHRSYFQTAGRGFGEDAFHVMWWMLFRELRPVRFLEIGVYRGQTLSLAALLQRKLNVLGSVTGISPFSPAGDACSTYRESVNYREDTLENFRHFNLPPPELVQAFSTDAAAHDRIGRDEWDAVYIDGNHDYGVARADWELCARHTRIGGIIVLDDASLLTTYRPAAFATAGHPGPSQLAEEIDHRSFREVLRVGHNRVFEKLA